MPAAETPMTLVILLSCCLGLLVLLLVLALRVLGKLNHLESLISQSKSRPAAVSEPAPAAPSVAETSPGGAFEAFLAEDPSRRDLTKSEQFAAYRQWRHEKGLNWSNS